MVVAAVIGLANTLALVGWNVIDPSNVSWMFGDNAAYHLGWAFYRHETQWTWPLTWTNRLGYPSGASIAFSDSLPLIPLLLRPVESLLSEPFQYLGLFVCLSFVLQTYFAFRLCQRLFPGQPGFVLMGGAFLTLSPPMTWQLLGHYSHVPHWLLIAGLDVVRRRSGVPPLRWMKRLWIVLAIAVGINGYFAAMCFIITLAGIARLRLEHRLSWRESGVLLALTSVVLVSSLLVFGLIVRDLSGYRAPGYGQLSFNLLAPINPMEFGSIVLPPLPIVDPGQFEGGQLSRIGGHRAASHRYARLGHERYCGCASRGSWPLRGSPSSPCSRRRLPRSRWDHGRW